MEKEESNLFDLSTHTNGMIDKQTEHITELESRIEALRKEVRKKTRTLTRGGCGSI